MRGVVGVLAAVRGGDDGRRLAAQADDGGEGEAAERPSSRTRWGGSWGHRQRRKTRRSMRLPKGCCECAAGQVRCPPGPRRTVSFTAW